MRHTNLYEKHYERFSTISSKDLRTGDANQENYLDNRYQTCELIEQE